MPRNLTIQDAQSIAIIRDGKCLSKEYINRSTPLKWRCKQGHTWDSPYSIIQQGGWCQQCAKNDKWLESTREIAAKNGGICLSGKYVKGRDPIKFQCNKGHNFLLSYPSLKKGGWCKFCYLQRQKDEALNKIIKTIEKKGGVYHSSKYENKSFTIKFQCVKGHQRFITARSIKAGEWCPECNKIADCENKLKKLKILAEKKGGKCLSSVFSQNYVKLKWQCKEGHVFNATPKGINKGSWCSICSTKAQSQKIRKYSIDKLRKLAEKKGGKLLSKEFTSVSKHLQWQCEKGHTWKAVPSSLLYYNRWCNICHIDSIRLPIKEFQEIAKQHKGKLLSEKYININTPLSWQCEKGHKWLAKPANIKNGSWCTVCAGKHYRLTVEILQKEAEKKNGKLLSKKYLGIETKLKWECHKGHKWMTTPHIIRSGFWCPKCTVENQKSSIEEFKEIAENKGGKLLSEKYIDRVTHLKWQCAKGHTWMTAPSQIKKGSWCRKCAVVINADKRRNSISDFQKYAKSRGGKFLSKEYVNQKSDLKWQCDKGHIWINHGTSILSKKTWCAVCALEERKKIKPLKQD